MFFNRKQSEPLAPVDHAWLRMEDPTNLMMVTSILIFDQPLDFARLCAIFEQRLLRFDRFRQRVVEFGDLARWEFDPNFTLSAHVHRVALAAPHDQQALEDLVSDLMSTPLDFSKSPWQFHLVENYRGGSALLSRLHHCIADGIALTHVLLSLTDPTPEPADIAPHGSSGAATPEQPGQKFGASGIGPLLSASTIAGAARAGLNGAATLSRLLLMSPDQPTSFKGPLGTAKRAAWSQPLPLEQVKAIGRAVGATVNDVLLAAAAGALRRYLHSRGEQVDGIEIRAAVPVNLRAPDAPPSLGNRFGLVFLGLPIGVDDPLDRLFDLKERMEALKGSPEAVMTFGILGALGLAPAQLQGIGVSLFGAKATAVMTNVPGPRQTIYLAGAPLREIMFWVPQSGRLGLGVSILSYAGSVTLGVATDAGLAPDPDQIVAAFHDEFNLLLRLASEFSSKLTQNS